MRNLPTAYFLLFTTTVEIFVLGQDYHHNLTLTEEYQDYHNYTLTGEYEDYEHELCDTNNCVKFQEISSKGITVDYTSCNGYFYTDEENDDQCRQSVLPPSIPATFGESVKECCGFHGFFVMGDCHGSNRDGEDMLINYVHLCHSVEAEDDFDDGDSIPNIPKKPLDCPAGCSVKTLEMNPNETPNITNSETDSPMLSRDGREYTEFCLAYSCVDYKGVGWQASADVCHCPEEPDPMPASPSSTEPPTQAPQITKASKQDKRQTVNHIKPVESVKSKRPVAETRNAPEPKTKNPLEGNGVSLVSLSTLVVSVVAIRLIQLITDIL